MTLVDPAENFIPLERNQNFTQSTQVFSAINHHFGNTKHNTVQRGV